MEARDTAVESESCEGVGGCTCGEAGEGGCWEAEFARHERDLLARVGHLSTRISFHRSLIGISGSEVQASCVEQEQSLLTHYEQQLTELRRARLRRRFYTRLSAVSGIDCHSVSELRRAEAVRISYVNSDGDYVHDEWGNTDLLDLGDAGIKMLAAAERAGR